MAGRSVSAAVTGAGVAPLTGCGVVVTRDESADGPLSTRLRSLGADVLQWPTVEVHPPDDAAPLSDALRNLESYDWIVFSSQHAVTAVTSLRRRCPSDVHVAAVGTATAEALRLAGWPVEVVPEVHGSDGLVAALARHSELPGLHVLYPASAIARPTVKAELERLGARVDQVTTYEVRDARLDPAACVASLDSGRVRAITFASPSALEALRRIVGTERCDAMLRGLAVAVIGPTTASALTAAGIHHAVVASPSTLDGLAQATAVAVQRTKERF